MVLYKVNPDVDYRFLYPATNVLESDVWQFKCNPLAGRLRQFEAFFDKDSDKPIPDIAYIGASTFAFNSDVSRELVDILERAGEVLPFFVDGKTWYCLNVLESLNALDEESSIYTIKDNGFELDIQEYVFHIERFSDSSLFKIPSDNQTDIFCVDRRETDEQVLSNFFCAVAAHSFTGLEFEVVCSEE